MRHRKSFNHLGRKSAHRNAMLANMAASLILHKRIETTTAKAKALRTYVEPLITKSKEDTTHSRRVVFSHLQNKEAVTELFREVAVKVHDRPGGYTRLLKLGTRLGDSAEMCIIELVDFNENMLAETIAKPKAGRRRRGSKKKDQDKPAVSSVAAEEKTAVSEEKKDIIESAEVKKEVEDSGIVEKEAEVPDDVADGGNSVATDSLSSESVMTDGNSNNILQEKDEPGSSETEEVKE